MEKPSQCGKSQRVSKSKSNLKAHKETHVKVENGRDCTIGGLSYSQRGKLDIHVRIHSQRSRLLCSQCDKIFSMLPCLQTHIDKKHNRIKRYKCYKCPKTFSQQYSFNKHKKSHTPKSQPCLKAPTSDDQGQVSSYSPSYATMTRGGPYPTILSRPWWRQQFSGWISFYQSKSRMDPKIT